MSEKYVLTGPPACGKTSVLLALEMSGEHVIRESAEDYIRLRQSVGIQYPWLEENFQHNVYALQHMRENRIPEGKRIFLDRGMVDVHTYTDRKDNHYAALEQYCSENRYDGVFFMMPQGGKDFRNVIRRESPTEAHRVGVDMLKDWRKFGYDPIIVPKASVHVRAARILSYVNGTVEDFL